MENATCVCCGVYIPEGSMVCSTCKSKGKDTNLNRTSETLILGFDRGSDADEAVLSVSKHCRAKLIYLKNFFGEDANSLYRKLTNKS